LNNERTQETVVDKIQKNENLQDQISSSLLPI